MSKVLFLEILVLLRIGSFKVLQVNFLLQS